MNENPWGDSPLEGYESVSDIELEYENQDTLLKEQGSLIEFVTAAEIQGTLDEMSIGGSSRQGDSITAQTHLGALVITSPLRNEWFEDDNITDSVNVMLKLSNIQAYDESLIQDINYSLKEGEINVDSQGDLIFSVAINFNQGVVDYDLRVALLDFFDSAKLFHKLLKTQMP